MSLRSSGWLFAGALGGLCALYLIQAATPLRLDNDAVDYLRIAAAVADGRPLPALSLALGFPYFLAVLDRAGIASSFFFVLANCFFLGLGLVALWHIFGGYSLRVRQSILLLTLLVIPVVKSVATPLPEAAFFGVSLLALSTATGALAAEGRKRLMLFALSFLLAVIATTIRLIGVALIPALLWSCLFAVHQTSSRAKSRWVGGWTVVIVLSLALLIVGVSRTTTFEGYAAHPQYWYLIGGLASPVAGRVLGMLTSWGQLVLNFPLSRLHALEPLYIATGMVSAIALLAVFRRSFRLTPISTYVVCYLGILAVWPYDSPRLWMPIAPLIIGYVGSRMARISNPAVRRYLLPAYAAWFALTGLGALAYSTRISFSGAEFHRLYGHNGGMASFGTRDRPASPEQISTYNVWADSVLRRYGNQRASKQQ